MVDTVRVNWREFDELNDYSYRDYYTNLNENIDKLSESERIEQYRKFCLWDTYYLLRYGCNMPFMDIPYAYARCQQVDDIDFNKGGLNNWMFLWFREGFKSTILTTGKIIQQILKYPERSHLLFSNTNPGAKDFLREIKLELERNQWLQRIFPDVLYKDPQSSKNNNVWSLDDGIVVKRESNRKEPTVKACGLTDGSMPTKFHVEYLKYDDAVTEESVRTLDRIEKTKNKIELSGALGKNVKTGGDDFTTSTTFVGTRYDDADAHGYLQEKGVYQTSIIPWYIKRDGKKVPRAHTKAKIRELRQKWSRYNFACQMELDPVPREDRRFKTNLTTYTDRNPQWDHILLVDPAGGGKEKRDHKRDNTAMAVIGRDSKGNEFFVDGVYDVIVNVSERMEAAFELIRKYNINQVWWERVGLQSDTQVLDNRMRKEKIYFGINEFIPNRFGSKEDRIERALMPRIDNRTLLFPEIMRYTNHKGRIVDLVDIVRTELKRFPHGEHDDMIDCLAQLIAVDKVGRMPVVNDGKEKKERVPYYERKYGITSVKKKSKTHQGPLVYI